MRQSLILAATGLVGGWFVVAAAHSPQPPQTGSDTEIPLPKLQAEPPPESPIESPLDSANRPADAEAATDAEEARAEPPAKAKIRQALEGNTSPSGNGDPLLEDVLKIIRRRGSILDGTALEPDAETTSEARPRAQNAPSRPATPDPRSPSPRRKARVAEMLLKSSRLLEGLDSTDPARGELVTKMRAEAARLLSP